MKENWMVNDSLNDYQEIASRSARKFDHFNEEITNWLMGLSGETGELIDHFKKFLFHGHDLDYEKVKKELGDILWYLSQAARVMGYDLSEIAQTNVDKLYARYQGEFSSEKSINRRDEN